MIVGKFVICSQRQVWIWRLVDSSLSPENLLYANGFQQESCGAWRGWRVWWRGCPPDLSWPPPLAELCSVFPGEVTSPVHTLKVVRSVIGFVTFSPSHRN